MDKTVISRREYVVPTLEEHMTLKDFSKAGQSVQQDDWADGNAAAWQDDPIDDNGLPVTRSLWE